MRHKRESLDWFIAFVMGRYDWISKRRTCITKLRKSHKAPAPAVVAPTVAEMDARRQQEDEEQARREAEAREQVHQRELPPPGVCDRLGVVALVHDEVGATPAQPDLFCPVQGHQAVEGRTFLCVEACCDRYARYRRRRCRPRRAPSTPATSRKPGACQRKQPLACVREATGSARGSNWADGENLW